MGFFTSNTKKPKVSVYETDQEAPKDKAYHLKTDPDNLIRIQQDYIADIKKEWDTLEEYWGLHVAGVTHREESVLIFIAGDNRQIELIEDPTPKHPHAIAVYGIWTDRRNRKHKEQLGFVPNEDARDIYKRRKKLSQYLLTSKINRMYAPTKEKNAGIMFDMLLMEPKWPRFEIHGVGKKSGRKRKKTYRAKTFDDALEQAYADDMIVDLQACKEIT